MISFLFQNIANMITCLRLCLAFYFLMVCIYQFKLQFFHIILFALGTLSDFLDGFLARFLHIESLFGRICDPIADKLLINGVAIWLFQINIIPKHLSYFILIKDFLLIAGSLYSLYYNIIPLSCFFGKAASALQMALIFGYLLRVYSPLSSFWINPLIHVLLPLMYVFSLLSLAIYSRFFFI